MSISPLYASNTLAGFGIGIIVLCFSIWLFIDRLSFLRNAISTEAQIVNVTYEDVPKGRGSIKAYIPTVALADTTKSSMHVKVDTYNEEPVYILGSKMAVLCNSTRSPTTCVESSVIEYLVPPFVALVIGLGFLSVGLYLRKNASDP